MRLIYSLILLFFLFSGISQSNETIKFIDINYIVNNSDAGKALNKIIESKTKTIESDIQNLAKKLEDKKKISKRKQLENKSNIIFLKPKISSGLVGSS